MKLYGLIGFPLSHSFSKKYFTNKFQTEGITDTVYELFPLSSITELPALLAAHPQLCGLNVTIPYKQEVLPYLDDKRGLPLQACNCIKIVAGKLIGFNTDVVGFEQSFIEKLQPHHKKALILGTGGAALAVQYVLSKLNIPFTLVSRSAGAGYTYEQLTKNILEDFTIIINTTPVGTFPKHDECPSLPYDYISSKHYCYDLVYNPAMTLFLEKAAVQGATIKNGSDMLKIQADESWDIWNSGE